ncbi:hypothetical protein EYZ11_001284 [Aspergillus tanneri]|uniref:Uncharacterized protein n=1 Tax=Aspergillus tanneri TaxID=1220188 RepID=A0A4S3JUX2_9EURO|nr:hypothetical protein EYZ11_001284 [Aspergillus tanneri]
MEQDIDLATSPKQNIPITIDVHGLKAKVLLNRPQEDIVPARYLRKADQSSVVQRTFWVFRGVEDARHVNLSKWSKIDIRFRGVYKTLKKAPQFRKGLYENDGGRCESSNRRFNFNDVAKIQGQVVYALLDEVMNMLNISRDMEDNLSYFFLRPRLLTCQMEYWTGYREKHSDAPFTAGILCLDSHPQAPCSRAVLPISTTTQQKQSLESALEGKFKLLLAQLLLHIHRLHPPGDKFPDQEVYLIGLHGSRLHIFRGIFPGHKTSRLWSGRHNPSSSDSELNKLIAKNPNERFYTKQNIERFTQQVEWDKLSTADGERDFRVFRILGSQEYDLWIKSEFRAAMRLIVGLIMYMMSGRARCGVLQHIFEQYPYDEGDEPSSEDEKGQEKAAKEEKDVAEQERQLEQVEKQKIEEDRERFWAREAMRSSVNDRIGGFKDFRQPWWEWVWEDKNDDGQDVDDVDDDVDDDDDDDVVLNGP